jgi:hypothetical protein
MGRLLTTVLLCAASMIGAAAIASQGFGPDPIIERNDAALATECESLEDEHARRDCLALKFRQASRQ